MTDRITGTSPLKRVAPPPPPPKKPEPKPADKPGAAKTGDLSTAKAGDVAPDAKKVDLDGVNVPNFGAEPVPPSSYGVTTMRGAMPCALWWSTDGVWGMSEESAPPVGVVRDTFY